MRQFLLGIRGKNRNRNKNFCRRIGGVFNLGTKTKSEGNLKKGKEERHCIQLR